MSESAGKTLGIATILCVGCSILVSGAVIFLRPMQNVNREIDFKKNILMSAGLLQANTNVNEAFKQIESIVINLETGSPVEGIDPDTFEQEKADRNPEYLMEIERSEDIAGIKRHSKMQKVYLVKKEGQLDQIVLHIYGKGLWSTMKGFLSLAPDTTTVKGFNFYSHAETPGLGGEVDNPKWISQWPGKKVYTEDFKPAIDVAKSVVNSGDPKFKYKIDGLSGATLTSVGIENTFRFWLSENGYSKFLENIRQGKIK